MITTLRAKLADQLGSELVSVTAAVGGDINQSFAIELRDGRRLFVKTHDAPPDGMYACEARGLVWLTEPKALRVPEVVWASEADERGPACLVLEHIVSARRGKNFDELLGQGLAALHRAGAPSFGLDHANYIALLVQNNTPLPTWARFYAERRIAVQTRLARNTGLIDAALARRLDSLCDKLEKLLSPEEPASRLHGDLWGGNVLCDEQGAPCLIDPAVYGGHREIDLAMMRLFGGFGERAFAAYAAAFPLAAGHAERVPLYQLYPLLVHVNLFGGGYAGQVERALTRYAAART